MLKVNNYYLKKHELINNIKIVFMSDLHYSNSFGKKLKEQIISKIREIKPDYIFITGDIIDNSYFLNNEKNRLNLLLFLKEISQNINTFIVLGSHDLENVYEPDRKFNYFMGKWKQLIKDVDNITILDNDSYSDDTINIIGITLPFEYYHELPLENVDIIINELNKEKYAANDEKYNILLIHSPRRVITKKSINNIPLLNKIDLILCGHMHDGVVPKFLKFLPTSIGFIAPQKTLFPKYARGKITKQINNHECTLLVTGGVNKISPALPSFYQKLKFLYNNDIELINIGCKNE